MLKYKYKMFISEVYKHNKWICIAIILFVAMQLLIGYKHGMVVSPFYNYGMYSHAIKIEKFYNIFEVTVNGKLLRGQDFTPQQWDKIMLPLQYYSNISQSNHLYNFEVKRLLNKFHIASKEEDFLQLHESHLSPKWISAQMCSPSSM